ncbi:MAG: S1 RNA-binding domain-containing protein, partial [Acidimicrobiia bacterium]
MTIENETEVEALDPDVQDAEAPAPTRVDAAESPETPETPSTEDAPVTDAPPVTDDLSPVDEASPGGAEDVAATGDNDLADAAVETAEPAPAPVDDVSEDADEDADVPAPRSGSDRGLRPAITAPRDIGHVEDDLSADDFAEAVDRTVFEFREGDIVAGKVVRVDPDEVLIDIGYKSEGVIPSNELSIRNTANPSEVVTVGDEIEALVLQ